MGTCVARQRQGLREVERQAGRHERQLWLSGAGQLSHTHGQVAAGGCQGPPDTPHLPRLAGEPLEIAACTRSSARPRLQWGNGGAAGRGYGGCSLQHVKICRTVWRQPAQKLVLLPGHQWSQIKCWDLEANVRVADEGNWLWGWPATHLWPTPPLLTAPPVASAGRSTTSAAVSRTSVACRGRNSAPQAPMLQLPCLCG